MQQYNKKHTILQECSIDVDKGDMIAITGQSGIGKSTLLNIIGCLDQPSSGNYWLNQQDLTKLTLKEQALIRKETFGYIFQQYWLIKHLTILENVELALSYSNTINSHHQQTAIQALKRVGLEQHLHHYPIHLSGGQQQKASIARAIVTNPSIIIADEPTGALDNNSSLQVMHLLRDINISQGTTMIVVTHDKDIANLCNKELPMQMLLSKSEKSHAYT